MLTKDDNDYLPLQLAVQVLGGSFTARLFHTLRTKLSLTYGSYASLAGFDDGYPGYLLAYAIFPNDVFEKGRTALRAVVKEFSAGGITARELAARKEEVAGKYKIALTTTAGMCGALFETLKSGKTVDYVDEYPALVADLTRREVNTAIKRRIEYARAVTTAAGSVDTQGAPIA